MALVTGMERSLRRTRGREEFPLYQVVPFTVVLITHHNQDQWHPVHFSFLQSRSPLDSCKIPQNSNMTESRINNSMSNTEFAKAEDRKKDSRRWRTVCAVCAAILMVGMMVVIALSRVAPSPRVSNYLFDRKLLFKGDSGEPGETCSGGDKCQDYCDLDASCDTDACQGACSSPDDARDCGCTPTANTCWNEDCEALCSQDFTCEGEACQAACNGDDEEKACGCTEPQPECFKPACETQCLEDPTCETPSCGSTCLNNANALRCGCGKEFECLNSACFSQCQEGKDPLCETQACQDTCVTEANTLACCGCFKPECGSQCAQDSKCESDACQEACGSLAMQVACRCVLPTDTPTARPTVSPTARPTDAPMARPTVSPTELPTKLITIPL
jgi:hypothetical protein